MTEYYTTITEKQVKLLTALKDVKIHITNNMLNYLYSLARQGRCLAKDNAQEEFRKSIIVDIGRLIEATREEKTIADIPSEEERTEVHKRVWSEYKEVEKDIYQQFRLQCARSTSRYLDLVKKDLESETYERKKRQKK